MFQENLVGFLAAYGCGTITCFDGRLWSSGPAEKLVLSLAAGGGEDGGAEVVGEALEAGLGGGGGEQGFFLQGEPDIDLHGPLHEGGGLIRTVRAKPAVSTMTAGLDALLRCPPGRRDDPLRHPFWG